MNHIENTLIKHYGKIAIKNKRNAIFSTFGSHIRFLFWRDGHITLRSYEHNTWCSHGIGRYRARSARLCAVTHRFSAAYTFRRNGRHQWRSARISFSTRRGCHRAWGTEYTLHSISRRDSREHDGSLPHSSVTWLLGWMRNRHILCWSITVKLLVCQESSGICLWNIWRSGYDICWHTGLRPSATATSLWVHGRLLYSHGCDAPRSPIIYMAWCQSPLFPVSQSREGCRGSTQQRTGLRAGAFPKRKCHNEPKNFC